jgi:hypothetical protein
MRSSGRGVAQSSYEIRVARSEQVLRAGQGLLWDSGKIVFSYPYAAAAPQRLHNPGL